MRGRRVVVSGMGGELGSLVATMLERDRDRGVDAILGVDADPPRRRLRRAEFHRIDPSQRDRIADLIAAFDPHVLVHVAVWEPDARAAARTAERLTDEAAVACFGGALAAPSLTSVVVRSGIEVYGRRRGAPRCPDESAAVEPTTEYGRSLAVLERRAAELGARRAVPVARLRFAPVMGAHVPSPLGRLLRQPIVPCHALGDPLFSVLHQDDAAAAILAAVGRETDGPVNVVAPGTSSPLRAIRRGRRVPAPLLGPAWPLARQMSHLAGAPIPDHVHELLVHGRSADGALADAALGIVPTSTTPGVIDALYAWPSVVRVPPRAGVA